MAACRGHLDAIVVEVPDLFGTWCSSGSQLVLVFPHNADPSSVCLIVPVEVLLLISSTTAPS
jgi:hypothetical protein